MPESFALAILVGTTDNKPIALLFAHERGVIDIYIVEQRVGDVPKVSCDC